MALKPDSKTRPEASKATSSDDKVEAAPRKGTPERRRAQAAGPSQADAYNLWAFVATLAGWFFLLLGQRVLAPMEGLATICTWIAILLLFGSFGQRLWAMAEAPTDRRTSARTFAILSAIGIAALILYGTTTDWGREAFGIEKPPIGEPDTFTDIMHVTWIALLVTSLLPTILGDLARQSMIRAERIEARRIISAVVGGLAVALALVYGALFTYGSGEVEWSADFSFFRTAKPSESTQKMVASLEEPLTVRLYFPAQSEVGQKVEQYLQDLNAKTGRMEIAMHDRLLVPDLAKEDKVRQDGVVVLARGEQTEQLTIGTEEARAANTLRKLDGEFQQVLLKVMREKRVAYLTIGHGELNESTDKQSRRTISIARELLESQNFGIKNLGLKEGLGSEVPDDATVVFVLGPTSPFSDAEIETLKRYADKGGSLFIALDPEAGEAEHARIAAIVGVAWKPELVVNDRILFAVERGLSDKKNLAAGSFSSHASVSSLMKQSGKAVVLVGSGPLDPAEGTEFQVHPTVKSPPQSYLDLNDNWTFDAAEEKKSVYNVAVAATRPFDPSQDKSAKPGAAAETRAFVVGDAEAFTDPVMAFAQTNQLLFLDAFRWLGGDESFIGGALTDEEDVRIVHTKEEDQLWFYGTILGVPGLVLGVGLLSTRRRRRKTGPVLTNEGDRPRPRRKAAKKAASERPAAAESDEGARASRPSDEATPSSRPSDEAPASTPKAGADEEEKEERA